MNYLEYIKVKDYSYRQYCDYLKEKYGEVKYVYGDVRNSRSEDGLFIHHIGENKVANLSSKTVMEHSDSMYQQPSMLVYCDYLEHLLLHILIGEETAGQSNLGLNGAFTWLIPSMKSFFLEGKTNKGIHQNYYEVIRNYHDTFNPLLDRYNKLVKNRKVLLDTNTNLYLEMEDKLNTKNKALIVLGTGLGKTTTALQYLWENSCRALVIGPNNLIKNSWEEYGEYVDTITYTAFSNQYKDIDYSKYGLVILDEAHHAGYNEETTIGAKVWSKGINYILKKNIKLLGLTATPERSDNIDIGKTIFKDCVCEGRAVEDAIKDGTIYPFSYVTAIYNTDKLIEEVKNKYDDESETVKTLFGQLNLAINNTPTIKDIFNKYLSTRTNKRKGIIFIQEIADKEYVTTIFKDIFPNIEYRAIDSKMDKKEVEENREWFKNTNEGYLLAVNMISEGAHYKGVNTLIMFRRTSSYLVFTQQLGRIITLIKDEDPQAIVFDLVNNIDNVDYSEMRVSKEKKHRTIDVIKALEYCKQYRKSDQIIIADETREIVKCIKALKETTATMYWQEWEDEIIRKYYPTKGAMYCLDLINKRWEQLENE